MPEIKGDFAVRNDNHFCGFFKTPEEAEKHLSVCLENREKDPYVAALYGPSTVPCLICKREETDNNTKPFLVRFPWGISGMIKREITVFCYLDYVETAKKNS